MNPSEGLVNALNKMREWSSEIYHQYVPIVTADTNINDFGKPILDSNLTPVYNEFFTLIKRIAMASIDARRFSNPLTFLEGEELPLGYAVENIHVNPVKGRQFNVNDMVGLLQKYDANIKTEYLNVNVDLQFPVSVTRAKVRNAFTSWGELENFINGIIESLYNSAEIKQYELTKGLISTAFKSDQVQYEVVTKPTDEASSTAFVKTLRKFFTKFRFPSADYNAWQKVNTTDSAVITHTNPEDVVIVLASDYEAEIDVDVLAHAFNMDKATLLGRVVVVDNFDVVADDGTIVFDGSHIMGMIADRRWFKIRMQDREMDEFYNPNSRVWTYWYNITGMYNYSLMANAVVLCDEAPAEDGGDEQNTEE